MRKDLVAGLQQVGLNSYEAKVYLALLHRRSLSVSEVSKLSQVPRARTYDILDTLVKDGYAILHPGKHRRYSAVDLDTFKDKLHQKNTEIFSKQEASINNVTMNLKQELESCLKDKGSQDDPLEYIAIVKDPYQIHKKFMQLCDEAKREILMFVKPPYSGTREQIEEQLSQRAELVKRGVVIKGVYDLPAEEEQKIMRFRTMSRVIRRGEQARIINELPMKMAIFDEKIVVIALEDPVSGGLSLTTLVIEHRSLAKSLKILFNHYMEMAEDHCINQSKNT